MNNLDIMKNKEVRIENEAKIIENFTAMKDAS